MEEELAPLTVQLAFVLGRLGRSAEAHELHEKVGWRSVERGAVWGGAGTRNTSALVRQRVQRGSPVRRRAGWEECGKPMPRRGRVHV